MRSKTSGGFTVTRTTSITSAPTLYKQELRYDGILKRTETRPDGTTSRSETRSDGTVINRRADGTIVTAQQSPDPVFGMQTPVPSTTTITLPSGLTRTSTETRTVTFDETAFLSGVGKTERTERATNGAAPWVTEYDGRALTETTTSPEGRRTVVSLDRRGRVTHRQVPGLFPTSITYDAHGRVEAVKTGPSAEGRRIVNSYRESDGYLASTSGPLASFTTTFEHDALGRPLAVTDPDGEKTEFAYDGMGRLRHLTPPGRPAHELRYNPVGLVTEYVAPAPSGGAATVRRTDSDNERRVDLVTQADGRTIDYQYDQSKGRLTDVVASSSARQYGYNPTTGQLSSVTMADAQGQHQLSFGYDGMLPTRTTWSGDPGRVAGSVSRRYDNDLRLRELVVNGQSIVAYGYDRDGLLTSAGSLTMERDAGNGLLTGTRQGALATSVNVDGYAELSAQSASFADTPLYQDSISARDELGRILERTQSIGAGTATEVTQLGYRYDLAGRLHEVLAEGIPVSVYDYDANGNRIAHTTTEGIVVGRYDDQDRLLRYCPEDELGNPTPSGALPCFEQAYRASGELFSKTDVASGAVTEYEYDELGNLRGVVLPSGTTVEYEIDAANRRIGKTINGVRQYGLLYKDQLEPVAMLDANNAVIATFVYGTREHVPDYMVKGGATYRFVTDHLGSVRMVVNVADGAVAQYMGYDEFGNVLADTNPGFQPFGFAGGLYDADTGLVRFGARDYDAVTGRWTAKDPILFRGGTTNLYEYCASDPANLTDPTGEVVPLIIGLGIGVGLGVAIGLPLWHLWENYDDMKEANYKGQDKYFHCKAHCEATRSSPLGEAVSTVGGDAREASDRLRKGDTDAMCFADQVANQIGRSGALDSSRSCEDICGGYRPNGLPNIY